MDDPLDPKCDGYNFIREKARIEQSAPDSAQPFAAKLSENNDQYYSSASYALPAPSEVILAVKKIPNTRWIIALTSKDHEFFHNRDTRASHWEMPDELGLVIGDLLADAFGQGPESDEEGVELYQQHQQQEVEEAEESDEEEVPHRHIIQFKPSPPPPPPPALIIEELSHSERIQQYTQLLHDKDVDPFGTWDKTLLAIISDKRYPLIKTLKERKNIFESYCAEAAKTRLQTRNPIGLLLFSTRYLMDTDAYRALLVKHCTFRTLWDDFSRKHRLDGAFMSLTDHSTRETEFRACVTNLKVQEADRRQTETQKNQKAFMGLLDELVLTPTSRFDAHRLKLSLDPRSKVLREEEQVEAFNDYVINLTQMQKRSQELQEKRDREEASMRERTEKVEKERRAVKHTISGLQKSSARDTSLAQLETIFVNYITVCKYETLDAAIAGVLRHASGWDACSKQIPAHILQSAFAAHTDSIFRKITHNLDTWICGRTSVCERINADFSWERGWEMMQSFPMLEALNPVFNLAKIQDWFRGWRSAQIEGARQGLEQALRENSFVETCVGRSEEGQGDDGDDDDAVIAEIMAVLEDDSRFLSLADFGHLRESIIRERIGEIRGDSDGKRRRIDGGADTYGRKRYRK